MAFPTNPTNNQTYVNAIGTQYRYIAIDNKWIIDSTAVTGNQGITGVVGITGPAGVGLTGARGATGAFNFPALSDQTLRYNGLSGTWEATSSISNDGLNVSITGALSIYSDIQVGVQGSIEALPRQLSFIGFEQAGNAARYQFGDAWNATQNAYGRAMQITSYHTLILAGLRNTFGAGTPLAFENRDNACTLISNDLSTQSASLVLAVRGSTGQTGDLQQWWNPSEAILARMSSLGVLTVPIVVIDGTPSGYTPVAGAMSYTGGNFVGYNGSSWLPFWGVTGSQGTTGTVGTVGTDSGSTGTINISYKNGPGNPIAPFTGVIAEFEMPYRYKFNSWRAWAPYGETGYVRTIMTNKSYSNYPPELGETSMSGLTGPWLNRQLKNTGNTNVWLGPTGAANDIVRIWSTYVTGLSNFNMALNYNKW